MVYIFALGAGLWNAVGSVLQHRVVATVPQKFSMRPGLILEVMKHPVWLAGIGLDVGAYILEAAALGVGSIVVVQTLMVSGLLFALPLSAIGRTARPGRGEWVSAFAVAGGIAIFLAVGDPHGGSSHATGWEWAAAFVFCLLIMAFMVISTRHARPHYRALGLGVATGASYACTAALTKQVVDLLSDHGVAGIFGRWPVYALAVFAVGGLLMNQSAFQAGHLAASLPALAVTNPVLSSFFGVFIFEEKLGARGLLQYSITAMAVGIMVFGVIKLARSPFVTGDEEHVRIHPPITPASP